MVEWIGHLPVESRWPDLVCIAFRLLLFLEARFFGQSSLQNYDLPRWVEARFSNNRTKSISSYRNALIHLSFLMIV